MIRRVFTAAAALTLLLAPASAFGQGERGYYTATFDTPPGVASFIIQTTIWKCSDGVCTAAKSTMRDSIMCERVARNMGKLSTFSVRGEAFDAEALERCNARAH